ncbi:ion transporter [Pseudaeromonas sp. ZJS20]|uniref:ion transporter n=1 Tax=Pseudaeromonas aegiceratis TaxID=3153928 RepID=UPI00390C4398
MLTHWRQGPVAGLRPWQRRAYTVIFLSDTPAGRRFDVALIVTILLGVVLAMLDSLDGIVGQAERSLQGLEWLVTVLFTLEYGWRLACVRRPSRYVLSFWGLVDLAALLPGYLSLLFPGAIFLSAIRILRILRIFQVLNLAGYLGAEWHLVSTLWHSRQRILVFLLSLSTLICLMGTLIFVIEGPEHGFTSIPTGMYWAVITVTTVGYGDLVPQSVLGKALASLVMLLGYAIIAVPSGLVTAKVVGQQLNDQRRCTGCGHLGHAADARFCRQCGTVLPAQGGRRASDKSDSQLADRIKHDGEVK